ncbi:heparinase II/III family protein [bacterium]|nr:heparinase II/III family protein [bacterium]
MSCSENEWPIVACTPEELSRLRTAYEEGGERGEVVARVVEQADKALRRTISFPPEGGQHNQWYQCDRCQIGLETVDDTHHKCLKCGEIYLGYPYDNVIYSKKFHGLTRDMNRCAWAFALTGKLTYAQKARDILVEFAERYETYPLHSANQGKRDDPLRNSSGHIFEQTLNEASWTESVVETYDLARQSDAFSSTDHVTIRTFLRALAANIWKHKAGKSNWQTYHNSAFILIGGVLGDDVLVERALTDPGNGHDYQMDVSVLPGGMWYENSWSYHFYTLGAVERVIETGRRLGIDLYQDPRVKSMYTVAMDYVMADGTLPRFGDALTTGTQGHRFETAYHYWKDPAFLAVLPEGPTWDSILLGRDEIPPESSTRRSSELKKGAGHAILRVSGPDGPSSAVMTFGPFGGFHGHFDKLSFVYFSVHKELGYDPGRAKSQAYRLPIHRNWYRATTSHNTVMVDRDSQEGAEGVGEWFGHNDDLAAAVARVDSAYEGVTHRRMLVLRPGYLLVVDELKDRSGRERVYDWLYHNVGQSISSDTAEKESSPPEGQGFEFIEEVRTGVTDGLIRASVDMNGDAADIVIDGQEGSTVLIATGVGESVLDRIPMVMVTRRGTSARFGAVVEPRKGAGQSRMDLVTAEEEGLSATVQLTDGSQERFTYTDGEFNAVILDPDGRESRLYPKH